MKSSDKRFFAVQVEICKALANEKRLAIVHLLAAENRQTATQLMETVGLTKTNLSQHMRLLRHSGMVVAEREGTRIFYELASPKIGNACEMLREFAIERLEENGALVRNDEDD
jgi:ArsR family transcriptional regulator